MEQLGARLEAAAALEVCLTEGRAGGSEAVPAVKLKPLSHHIFRPLHKAVDERCFP